MHFTKMRFVQAGVVVAVLAFTPCAAGVVIATNFSLASTALPALDDRVAAQYNSGLVPVARLKRDLPLLAALHPPAFRVDVGMGWDARSGHLPGIFGGVVQGTVGGPLLYNTSVVVATARLLRAAGAQPVFSWCYIPPPLQNGSGGFTLGPNNLARWADMHARLATDLRSGASP